MESKTHKKDYFHILKIPFESIKSYTRNQLLVVTGLGFISLYILLYFISSYKKEKNLLVEEIKKQWEITLKQYPEPYEKELFLRVGFGDDNKNDSITVVTENTTQKISNEQERQPLSDFLLNGLYTILYTNDLFDINKLNTLLQENLKKKGIKVKSILWYHHKEEGIESYSENYNLSFKPLFRDPIQTGFTDEIELQCFIHISFVSIIKEVQYWYLIIIWLFFFAFVLFYILKVPQRDETIINLEEIANNISTSQSRILFNAFLKSPNHQLTNKEISHCLWGYEKLYDGSIRTNISRLRKELEPYSFISIKNIHGTGYELIIKLKNNNDVRV